MKKFFKGICHEIEYVVLNYIICNIPFWPLRKLLYLLFGMKIGRKSRILMKTIILRPQGIVIGDNTIVNEYCYLDGRGGLKIGSNTTIAVFCKILTGYHDIDSNEFKYLKAPVTIGSNVACFANTVVVPGTIIKDGVVIGAGSVCKKGIYKEKKVYAGNPIMYIKERNIDDTYYPPNWNVYIR